MSRIFIACVFFAYLSIDAAPLKIHFLDVADGDCEIIRSPDGKNVLIDAGSHSPSKCKDILDFCASANISDFDYVIISHYDADHINCIADLTARLAPDAVVFDRGGFKDGKDSATFARYRDAVGAKRRTASKGDKITLDNGKLVIAVAALNGNGVSNASNENDLSLVSLLHYGSFDASFGGDIAGYDSSNYKNVETSVAPLVGRIEVYKAHNHCGKNSTNPVWLHLTSPQIAILSVGPLLQCKHPSAYCVERLHKAGIACYWTEPGSGAPPDSLDHVWGTIAIEVNDDGTSYTVSGSGGAKSYRSWPDAPVMASKRKSLSQKDAHADGVMSNASPAYEWSAKGSYYHLKGCPTTKTILEENRMSGNEPPEGKKKHSCVK